MQKSLILFHPNLVLLLLVGGLQGCMLVPAHHGGVPERPLVKPASDQPSQRITQVLEITRQQETFRLLGVIERAPSRTALAVFTPEGLKLFSTVLDPDGLHVVKNPLLPGFVDPRNILAEAQLVNWPLGALRSALQPPWRLEQTDTSRRLWWCDRLISEAIFDGSVSQWRGVDLTQAGYRLKIRTLEGENFD